MVAHTPRVSIGLPVYNGERYLALTIDSILAQTFADFELIISDNASTDSTESICLAYAARDARIRYFRNARNLGLVPNYNNTVKLARGHYFKWCAYDDLMASTLLQASVNVLDHDASVGLVYWRCWAIDDYGAVIAPYDPNTDTSSPLPEVRFHNLVMNPPTIGVQIFGLVRRETLLKTQLHVRCPSGDEVALAELALHGRFRVLEERHFYPRLHASQSTRGRYTSPRARVTLFDTSRANTPSFHKWEYMAALVRAVKRAGLEGGATRRCYATILRWAIDPHHMRALLKDIPLGLAQGVRMVVGNAHGLLT